MPLAALTKHLVVDLGPPGPDNAFGAGVIHLPAAAATRRELRAERVHRTRRTGSPARHQAGDVHRPAEPRRAVPAVLDRRSARSRPTVSFHRRPQQSLSTSRPPTRRASSTSRRCRLLAARSARSRRSTWPRPGQIRPNFADRPARSGLHLDLHPDRRKHHRRRDGLLHTLGPRGRGPLRSDQSATRCRHSTSNRVGRFPRAGPRIGRRSASRSGSTCPPASACPLPVCLRWSSTSPQPKRVVPGSCRRTPPAERSAKRRRSTTSRARTRQPTRSCRSAPTEPSASSHPTRRTSSWTSRGTSPTARHRSAPRDDSYL